MDGYTVLISQQTWDDALEPYRQEVNRGGKPGRRLEDRLLNESLSASTEPIAFLRELVNTKQPQIFAESAVFGNGLDWNQTELSILGDITMAMPVDIFDDGRHQMPKVHGEPLEGTLLFTPGALLRNGRGESPADFMAVTVDQNLDSEKYLKLYERRLLPPLIYADEICKNKGKKGFITIPGLGCGVFAGRFKGKLGEMLNQTLQKILDTHVSKLQNIKAIYYDPYGECQNERYEFNELSYMVRPLLQSNDNKPQLCHPIAYEEAGDDFANCEFFSFVAWDHVSWPGNDYYIGSRATDDGVKGAATDTMRVMTGFNGRYDPIHTKYLPPNGFKNWLEIIQFYGLEIKVDELNLKVVG